MKSSDQCLARVSEMCCDINDYLFKIQPIRDSNRFIIEGDTNTFPSISDVFLLSKSIAQSGCSSSPNGWNIATSTYRPFPNEIDMQSSNLPKNQVKKNTETKHYSNNSIATLDISLDNIEKSNQLKVQIDEIEMMSDSSED
ncbi:MAG: hypothetical protein MHPSP_000307 [Paramarteilia canceri]